MPSLQQIAAQALDIARNPGGDVEREPQRPIGTNPPLAPVGRIEHAQTGLETGVQGAQSMVHGLRAIGAQAIGADPTEALEDMRLRDAEIQRETTGVESFEDFITEPTLTGFLDQVALATGELAPSLASSVVSGGAGALAGGLAATMGKQVIGKGARLAARQLLKEELQKKARGEVLDPDVEDTLEIAYQGLRKTVGARRKDVADALAKQGRDSPEIGNALRQRAMKRGAAIGGVAGAAGGEYPLNAGSLGAEAFEAAGPDGPSRAQAVGALAAAGPLSAIGGTADAIVFRGLAKLAKKRAAASGKGSSVYMDVIGKAAKGAGLASAVEGITEGIQETGAVGFREAIDPGYVGNVDNKALLRIGEAAFKGAAGSIVAGGAGGAVARIIPKARGLIEQSERGSFREDGSAAEPARDVLAQVASIERPADSKETAYFSANTVEGVVRGRKVPPHLKEVFREAKQNPGENIVRGDTAYRAVDENGRTAIAAAFAGDAGTPTATERMTNLENFVQGPNDEEAQAAFLGHREPIPEAGVVLSVRDEDGGIRHQSVVDRENLEEEKRRFATEFPGATIEESQPEDILSERAEGMSEQGDAGDEVSNYQNLSPQMRASARRVYQKLRNQGIDPIKAGREQITALRGVGAKTADAFAAAVAAGDEFLSTVRERSAAQPKAETVPDIPSLPSPDGDDGSVRSLRLDTIGIRTPRLEDALRSIENDPDDIRAMDLGPEGDDIKMRLRRERAAEGLGPLLTNVSAPASMRNMRDAEMRQLAGRIKRSTKPETQWRLRREFVELRRQARFDTMFDEGGVQGVMDTPGVLRIGVRRMLAAEGVVNAPAVENSILSRIYGEERVGDEAAEETFAVEEAGEAADTIDDVDPTEASDQPDLYSLGFQDVVEGYGARDAADGPVSEESYHQTEWVPEPPMRKGKKPKPRINGWKITQEKFSGVPDDMRNTWEDFLERLSPQERGSFIAHEEEMSQSMVKAILQGPISTHAGEYLFEVRKEPDSVAGADVLRIYRRSNFIGASADLAVERFVGRVTERLRRSDSRPNPLQPTTNSTLVAVTPEGDTLPLHRNAFTGMARNGMAMNAATEEGLFGPRMNERQALRAGFMRSYKELALRDWRFLDQDGRPWNPGAPKPPPPELDGFLESYQAAFDALREGQDKFERENPNASMGEVSQAVAPLRAAYEQAKTMLSTANERVIAAKAGYDSDEATLQIPLARMKGSDRRLTVKDILVDTRDPYPVPESRTAAEMQAHHGLPVGDYLALQATDEPASAGDRKRELDEYMSAQDAIRAAMRSGLVDIGLSKDEIATLAEDTVVYDRDAPLRDGVMEIIASEYRVIARNLRNDKRLENNGVRSKAWQFLRAVRRAYDERQREHSGSVGVWIRDNPVPGWQETTSAVLDIATRPDPRLAVLRKHLPAMSSPAYADRVPIKTRQAFFNALEEAERQEAGRVRRRSTAEFVMRLSTAGSRKPMSNNLATYAPVANAMRAHSGAVMAKIRKFTEIAEGRAVWNEQEMAELDARIDDLEANIERVSKQVAQGLARQDPQYESELEDGGMDVREENYLVRKYLRAVPGGQAAMAEAQRAEADLERLKANDDVNPATLRAAENRYDRAILAMPSMARIAIQEADLPKDGPVNDNYSDILDRPEWWEGQSSWEGKQRQVERARRGRLRSRLRLLDDEILRLEQAQLAEESEAGTLIGQLREEQERIAPELARLDEKARKEAPPAPPKPTKRRVRVHDIDNELTNQIVKRFGAEIGSGLNVDVNVVLASGMKERLQYVEPKPRNVIASTLAKMDADKGMQGFTRFGRNSATIVLRDDATPQMQALTLAHELGHVFWRGEIDKLTDTDNKLTPMGEQLWNRYRSKIGKAGQFTKDMQGFEEWYADQVGAYLLREPPADLPGPIKAYFQRVAERLRAWLTNSGRAILGARFQPNQFAQEYVTNSMLQYRYNTRRLEMRPSPTRQAGIAKLTLDVGKVISREKAQRWKTNLNNAWRSGTMETLKTVFYPANAHLNEMSPELARFFAARSQTADRTGFHDSVAHAKNRAMFAIGKALGIEKADRLSSWHTEEVNVSLLRAEDDQVADADLDDGTKEGKQAMAVRQFLSDVYEKYLPEELTGLRDQDIRRRANYFPRLLSIDYLESSEIARQELAALIERYATDEDTRTNAMSIVREIVSEGAMVDGLASSSDRGFRPGMAAKNQRGLAFIPTSALRDSHLVKPPLEALTSYMDHAVKTREFYIRGGSDRVLALLKDVEPEHRALAERNVRGQLGFLNIGLSPGWRKFNAASHALTAWTTLAFSVFGSLGEPMAAMVRTNGVVKFADFARQMVRTGTEEENKELARALGVVAPEAMETVMGSMDAINDVSSDLQKGMSFFFRATGLSAITQYTRELAAGMGREFLLNAAKAPEQERNARYLSNLNVTAAQVRAWDEAGRPMEGSVAVPVKNAIVRFVDETSVRPTPGSRPALGNDPRFRAIYSLKTFSYDFGVRFVAGMGREVMHLGRSGAYGPAALILGTAAALFLPVAILALEAREWLKFGVRSGLEGVGVDVNPAGAFRSDRMGGFEYAVEIMDRSGLLGPFAVATSMGESIAMGANPVVSQIPIADLVADVLSGNYDRAVPVVSNAL